MILTIAMGVYPKPIFDVTGPSVAHLVEQFNTRLEAAKLEAPRLAEVAP